MQLNTTQKQITPGGIASLADHLADYGRNGDTYIVHAAEGETVIPMEVLNSNPRLKQMLFNQMRNMGIEPERYIIGNELNSINPVTGQPEFFLKKIGKGLKKALKKLAPLIGFAAGAYAQQRFAPNSRLGASFIPGATTALATKLAGGSTGKSLAYGGLGALAGSAMFDPKLGAFASRPSISPVAPLQNVPAGGIGNRSQVYPLGKGPASDPLQVTNMNVPILNVPTGLNTTMTDNVIKSTVAKLNPNQITGELALKISELSKDPTFNMLDPVQQEQLILNLPASLAPARKGGFLQNLPPSVKLAGLGGLGYLAMKESKRDDVDLRKLKSAIQAEREMGTVTGEDLLAQQPQKYGFDPRSFVPFGDLSLLPPDVLAEAIRNFGPAVNAAKGGYIDVVKADQGGEIVGPGTGTSDSIPAMLSDGEFVMTANAVKGAGNGNRREGARKMYQMMKRLEASKGGLARVS
jgi:hypothetical protein